MKFEDINIKDDLISMTGFSLTYEYRCDSQTERRANFSDEAKSNLKYNSCVYHLPTVVL
jgi:hypothetical protein